MSFCQVCGTSLTDGNPTCPACGATQGVAATGTATGAMPGPPPPSAPMYPAQPVAGAGLTPNVAGALCYLVGAITGILFLVVEPFKNDRFVRFHAFQSIFFNLAWIAFWIVWGILVGILTLATHGLVMFILGPLGLLISLAAFCLWIYLMYCAYQGKTVQLPVVGPLAASQAGIAPAPSQRL